jgi:hypothetical protein
VPEAADWSDRLHAFAATVDWDDVERKPLTVTFHYRRAEDESEALRMLEAVATRARHEGLIPKFGRKVLELRPPVGAHKGTAVAHLLGERGLERALYAGDDTTDSHSTPSRGWSRMGGGAPPEAPAELRETADPVVDSPTEFVSSCALRQRSSVRSPRRRGESGARDRELGVLTCRDLGFDGSLRGAVCRSPQASSCSSPRYQQLDQRRSARPAGRSPPDARDESGKHPESRRLDQPAGTRFMTASR